MDNFVKGNFRYKDGFKSTLEYVELDERLDIIILHFKDKGSISLPEAHPKYHNWSFETMKDFINKGEWVEYAFYLYDIDDLLYYL